MTFYYMPRPETFGPVALDREGGGGGGLYRKAVKRLFDILFVLVTAPVAVPLVAILALIVARDGGSPFYVQHRVGRGGRLFAMWKLRTMVADADRRLEQCLRADPALRAEWEHSQKLRRDPRVTLFGRFLRKSSLDELPQLWNVLKGDMSVVGPRPMMPEQRALYPGDAYYRLRPGITGAWQVSDRNRTSFAARAEYDAAYERSLSLKGDMAILMATAGAVARGTGC